LSGPIDQAASDIKVGAIFDHTAGIHIYVAFSRAKRCIWRWTASTKKVDCWGSN
jgi:hypothetical protein